MTDQPKRRDDYFDEALHRRILAAAWSAGVRRSTVEFDWPECHKPKCRHHHGEIDAAFGHMRSAIVTAIENEMRYRATTRPEFSVPGDSPEETAALNLAILLKTYNVHDAGTYINAARLLVDAHPELVAALTPADGQENNR